MLSKETYEKIRSLAEAPIEAVFTEPTYGKFERGEALDNIKQETLEEECDEEGLKFLSKTVDTVRKQVLLPKKPYLLYYLLKIIFHTQFALMLKLWHLMDQHQWLLFVQAACL